MHGTPHAPARPLTRRTRAGPWAARLLAALSLAGAVLASLPAAAQEPVDDAVCALCHDDVELGSGDGHEFLHAGLSCLDCHSGLGFDLELMEHPAQVPPADCGACHAEVAGRFETSGHAEAELGCALCHGAHDVRSVDDADAPVAASRLNALCARCHAEIARGETDDLHAAALVGRTCLACHDPHRAAPAATLLEDENCLGCHAGDGAGADDAPSAVAASAHGQAGIGCVLCHQDLQETESYPHGTVGPVDCGGCHAATAEAHERGSHARTTASGNVAAGCADCHGGHDVFGVEDPRSRVFPLNLPDTCEACHRPEPPPGHPAPAGAFVQEYETSVHGRALREGGLVVTATCRSCHGSHEIHAADEPGAPMSRELQPYTCGSCHVGILTGYLSGVHGAGFLAGGQDVPVCTDCHSEHSIAAPGEAGSSVSTEHVAATCLRCHADHELAATYGLRKTVLASWGRSYHGIASGFGDRRAANCASCHGFHAIYPSSDPRSQIHPDQLEATCGGCHTAAGAAFSQVPVHSVIERDTNFVAWLVRGVYLVLITATIGAFLCFILVDLFGLLRVRMGWGPAGREPDFGADEGQLVAPGETFRRFSLQGRLQHGVLVTSFLLLVLTGLPVFLHDLPLFRSLLQFEGAYRLRGLLHRAGAVGLIGLSAWHVGSVLLAPKGRRWIAEIMFRPHDVTDFLREFMFNLGLMDWLSRRRRLRSFFERHPGWAFREQPRHGRYSLVEKLEYWAVVWGNVVMISSGTLLWRPDWFLGHVPLWLFDLCRVIHGFEATLAFLAIIIWHMYHVHLRPGVFPMSEAWLTGRISAKELRLHHPLEYARILERRRTQRGEPPTPGT